MGCRFVRIYDTYVIKYGCPSDSRSGGQNLFEAAQWERVKGTPAEIAFAPILEYATDGSWLKMRRVDRVLDRGEHWYVNAFADHVRDTYGYSEFDRQGANTGILDGRPVFIDYGFQGYNKGITADVPRCEGTCIYCSEGSKGEVEYVA